MKANAAAAESPAMTVKLGASDLEVSRLGIGTIQWGDTTKGYGPTFDEASVLLPASVDTSDASCSCWHDHSHSTFTRGRVLFLLTKSASGQPCVNIYRSQEDLYASFEAARVGGINFFDTAEVIFDGRADS